MRIVEYIKKAGLHLEEIKARIGSPSPYSDSRNHTLMSGYLIEKDGSERFVRGTMVLTADKNDLVISSIRAMDSGAGSMVMQEICNMADAYGLRVSGLNPSPYALSRYSSNVRKLNKKELKSFYMKFGFVLDDHKLTMSRGPNIDRGAKG